MSRNQAKHVATEAINAVNEPSGEDLSIFNIFFALKFGRN